MEPSRTEIPSSTTMHKPSEHDGKTVDGGHDNRIDASHGFGGDKELAKEAGSKGGKYNMEDTARDMGGDFATSASQAE
ncbi:hypothetical protein OIO90_005506 [Microbotryomycetes sp. JL221]|nr:hypothetical protein OIO90_005506 [Microbotryomycetes sp. JL221]